MQIMEEEGKRKEEVEGEEEEESNTSATVPSNKTTPIKPPTPPKEVTPTPVATAVETWERRFLVWKCYGLVFWTICVYSIQSNLIIIANNVGAGTVIFLKF